VWGVSVKGDKEEVSHIRQKMTPVLPNPREMGFKRQYAFNLNLKKGLSNIHAGSVKVCWFHIEKV